MNREFRVSVDSPFSSSSIRTDNDSIGDIFPHSFAKVLKHGGFGVELFIGKMSSEVKQKGEDKEAVIVAKEGRNCQYGSRRETEWSRGEEGQWYGKGKKSGGEMDRM